MLAVITNFTLLERALLMFTNVASDVDLPPQKLTFILVNAPAGATINPTNGVISWRPSEVQGGTTSPISVVVTDNGPSSLSTTQSFTMIVNDRFPHFALSIGSVPVLSGSGTNLPVQIQPGVDLTNLHPTFTVSGNRVTHFSLSTLAPEISRHAAGGNESALPATRQPNRVRLERPLNS